MTVRGMAIVTASGLGVIAGFQVALALGVPWGRNFRLPRLE